MRYSLDRCVLFLLAFAACAAHGFGQTVNFLRVEAHELAVGQEARVHYERWGAEAGVRAPWPDDFDWFLVRVAGRQENLQALGAVRAREGTFGLALAQPGITLIAADAAPRIEAVSPAELRTFCATRCAAPAPATGRALAEAAGELRVRRLESSKLLVRALDDQGWLPSSATAQSKTGQRAELRPLADPTSVHLKSDLPLRVYLPGERPARTRVLAQHLESGRTQTFLTDAAGVGYFTVTAPGTWVVEAHALRAVPDDPAADWEVTSATLTFEVPVADPREGAETPEEKR